jgi:hypothetical protein
MERIASLAFADGDVKLLVDNLLHEPAVLPRKEVELDGSAKNRFQVVCEIRPVQDETQLLRACAIVAVRGLLPCKGWIDEHEQDG